jgi:hypothetical protein
MMGLGLTSGALLRVERGQANASGKYEIVVNMARVLQEADAQNKDGAVRSKEEKLYAKKQLGKLTVEDQMTVTDFKMLVFNQFLLDNDSLPVGRIESVEQFQLRNPKNDDLGDVMPDSNELLEQFFLYDGKELLVQKLDHEHIIC